MAGQDVASSTNEKKTCVCPFCEGAVDMAAPWCQVCGVELRFCAACEEPLPQDAVVCPNCGTECKE